MLCEGIYLHTLIIVAVFVGEQQLFWYYVLGWGKSGKSDTAILTTSGEFVDEKNDWIGYMHEDFITLIFTVF